MPFILAGVLLFGGLAASAFIFNAPLLIAVRLARRRLHPMVPRVTLSLGFALATAYRLWEMEWFDVWRHGAPALGYVLRAYVPWVVALGVAGWFVGGLTVRPKLVKLRKVGLA